MFWNRNYTSFKVSDKGVISHAKIQDNALVDGIPVYPFIFEAYSRFNPSMRHLSDKSNISHQVTTDNMLRFSKAFESLLTHNIIAFAEDGFSWDITYDGVSSRIHFGIVIPNVSNVTFERKPVAEDLINYHRFSKRTYPGQTNIPYPMLDFQCGGAKYIVYVPYFYGCQFYKHEQNGTSCLRISVHSQDTFNLTVACFKSEIPQTRTRYISRYPATSIQLQPWKKQIEDLSKQHNVDIWGKENQCQQNDVSVYLEWDWPADEEVDQYLPVLQSALSKYPRGLLFNMGLKAIILGKNLTGYVNNKKAFSRGMFTGDSVVIDISELDERHLHHEIYHTIESDDSKCDIYSYMLTDYEYIYLQQESGIVSEETMQQIKKSFDDKGGNPKWAVSDKRTKEVPFVIQSIQEFNSDDVVVDPSIVNIVGTPNSGLSLLAAILNCSKDVSVKPGSKVQMIIHKGREASWQWLVEPSFIGTDSFAAMGQDSGSGGERVPLSRTGELKKHIHKMIYITRHPLSLIKSSTTNAKELLNSWEKEQSIYYTYFTHYHPKAKYHIRYEDILLQNGWLRNLFRFLDIEFNMQYLHYGHFTHYPDIVSESRLFDKGVVDPENIDCSNCLGIEGVKEWWDRKMDSEMIKALQYNCITIGE